MHIHSLDLCFQGTPGVIGAYLLESGRSLALVETGAGSTLEKLLAAIRQHGFDPKQVGQVFVTHVHLDHAGAAGWWAQQGAQLYCHPNAAKHLIDPERLLESARMVYGDEMGSLWGDMLPAPAGRVTVLQDREPVRVGDVEVIANDTPGHARHHHAFAVGDVCFTGDVAGIRLDQSDYLSVASAPPQFDPRAYVLSVDRLAAANFRKLYLTHFGEVTDVAAHLAAYRQRITDVFERVMNWKTDVLSENETRIRYCDAEHRVALAKGVTDLLWSRYELANPPSMCADGVRLCIEKLSIAT